MKNPLDSAYRLEQRRDDRIIARRKGKGLPFMVPSFHPLIFIFIGLIWLILIESLRSLFPQARITVWLNQHWPLAYMISVIVWSMYGFVRAVRELTTSSSASEETDG